MCGKNIPGGGNRKVLSLKCPRETEGRPIQLVHLGDKLGELKRARYRARALQAMAESDY